MDNRELALEVEDTFNISNVGTVVTGVVLCEKIKWPDKIGIIGKDFFWQGKCGGAEKFRGDGIGYKDDAVGILLVGTEHRCETPGIERGMKLYLLESVEPEVEPEEKSPWWNKWI